MICGLMSKCFWVSTCIRAGDRVQIKTKISPNSSSHTCIFFGPGWSGLYLLLVLDSELSCGLGRDRHVADVGVALKFGLE